MRDKIIFIAVAVVAVVVAVLLFLFGTGNLAGEQTSNKEGRTNPAAVVVPFTKLIQGAQSSIPVRANYLITSANQLDELWKMISAAGTPPTIDFKTHAVLAIFAGDEPCSAINVAKIEDATVRTVSITIAKPDETCVQENTAASPYEIIVVEATPLPLTHADIPTVVSCPKS